MTLGVGNLVAVICIVISIIFAVVTNQATNALWWALLAIFAVLCGAHGRPGALAKHLRKVAKRPGVRSAGKLR